MVARSCCGVGALVMAAFRPSAGEQLRFLQPGVAYLQASFARWNSLRLPNNQGWPEGDSALQVSHASASGDVMLMYRVTHGRHMRTGATVLTMCRAPLCSAAVRGVHATSSCCGL
jgi:hypothetical protein